MCNESPVSVLSDEFLAEQKEIFYKELDSEIDKLNKKLSEEDLSNV